MQTITPPFVKTQAEQLNSSRAFGGCCKDKEDFLLSDYSLNKRHWKVLITAIIESGKKTNIVTVR